MTLENVEHGFLLMLRLRRLEGLQQRLHSTGTGLTSSSDGPVLSLIDRIWHGLHVLYAYIR